MPSRCRYTLSAVTALLVCLQLPALPCCSPVVSLPQSVRGAPVPCARKPKKNQLKKNLESRLEQTLLSLSSLGFLLPLVYLFSSWLEFADYALPSWVSWIGAGLFAAALFLLWKAHFDLGRNFTPFVAVKKEHDLVTSGLYRSIRHPIYTAHGLWALSQGLLLPNWLAGWSFFLLMAPLFWFRIPREERMLAEEFGESYREYQKTTGGLFPRFRGWKS